MTFKLTKTDAAIFVIVQTIIIACLPALTLIGAPGAAVGAAIVLIAFFAALILMLDYTVWVFMTRPHVKRVVFVLNTPLTEELIENYAQRLTLKLNGDMLEERAAQKSNPQ